jgi:acyl dehydratase
MTAVGDVIPAWVMPEVLPARMRTVAAILRDPNPVHWDVEATKSRGLGGRVINQGPLNVGYLANMLMAWQGPECIRKMRVQFADRVLDGEHITANGKVVEIDGDLATCDIWLERPDGSRPVVGSAVVSLSRT